MMPREARDHSGCEKRPGCAEVHRRLERNAPRHRHRRRLRKAPAIEVHIVKSTEPPGGMGETGTSAIVPAIANAIFATTGKRLRKMPIDANVLKQPV